MRRIWFGVLVLAVVGGLYGVWTSPPNPGAVYAAAQQQSYSYPMQGFSPRNSEASAIAGTVTTTVTSIGSGLTVIWGVTARCSTGTAAITIKDGSTTIWSSSAAFVGTTTVAIGWTAGLVMSQGNNAVVTLSTCGGGNTGVLDVQASTF